MYEYIKGTLIDLTIDRAIIETNGIGYQLHIPFSAAAKLPKKGETVLLYTTLIVREDSHRLFGFPSKEERALFLQLETITGIGPKTALTLVGHLEGPSFQRAVATSDIKTLCRVPGIGKKTAERLLLEMRDKLKKSPTDLSIAQSPADTLTTDAINALINLGYPSTHAQKAVQRVLDKATKKPTLTDLITTTLRSL